MAELNRIGFRILQELSIQSRVKRKDIAKRLHISPQLVSYTISRLEERGLVKGYTANMDPARFDLITVFVILSYTNLAKEMTASVRAYLQDDDSVTYLESLSYGADLFVEYCVPNLSFFNKRLIKLKERFRDGVDILSVLPVIVKHQFSRDYLFPAQSRKVEHIYSGDREPVALSSPAQTVLSELWNNPKMSARDLATNAELNVRTVLRVLRKLLDEQIVRTYSVVPDYQKIGIYAALVFIHTKAMTPVQIQQLVTYASMTPEIVSATKVIGHYGLLIKIESLRGYRNVLDSLREVVHFSNYYLYDIRDIIKCTYVPYSVLSSKSDYKKEGKG